jgi:hypothetical protein
MYYQAALLEHLLCTLKNPSLFGLGSGCDRNWTLLDRNWTFPHGKAALCYSNWTWLTKKGPRCVMGRRPCVIETGPE